MTGGRKGEPVMAFLLILVLGTIAFLVGMPLLILALEVLGAWFDHWLDRLETAAVRFCRRRVWY